MLLYYRHHVQYFYPDQKPTVETLSYNTPWCCRTLSTHTITYSFMPWFNYYKHFFLDNGRKPAGLLNRHEENIQNSLQSVA